MKLIITSINHKVDKDKYSFFIFDTETNRVIDKVPYLPELDPELGVTTEKNYFLPWGITQARGNIYIASNHTICSFDSDTLEYNGTISNSGAAATHQIAYHDGYIYRANTSNDTVTRIDLDTLEEIHFSFKDFSITDIFEIPDNDDSLDYRHLNSITVHDGKIYVLAHNRNMTESEVFILNKDMTHVESLSSLDFICHEIIISDGYLYSLGTSSGTLIKLDLATLNLEKIVIANPSELFLRGAVLKDNSIIAFANQRRKVIAAAEDAPIADMITVSLDDMSIQTVAVPEISELNDIQEYIQQK